MGINGCVIEGISLTITTSPSPNPVFSTTGEMSDMALPESHRVVRLVKPATGRYRIWHYPEATGLSD